MVAPSSAADSHHRVGALIAEKYRVERLLGTGGMGSVIEASHVSLGHRVALKVLHPEALGVGDALARFFREARATALLESEHVVKIHDIGTTEEGMPFLVMERLIGFDLGDLLMRVGPLPVGLAVECVYQAAMGVREAHAAGVIHRDLKPSNLFLAKKSDGSPVIKVLDFGISKVETEDKNVRLTQTRTIVGSPLYMSPEQVRDARGVSVRSDIWALGAILQELLTGQPAFSGDTLPSVCASIVSDDPQVITREEVPVQLRDVVLRCLEKNEQARIQSTDELMSALLPLRQMLPVEPLSALTVPFPERSSRESLTNIPARPFSSAMHSMPTMEDSLEAVMSETSSGVRRRASQPTLSSARLSDGGQAHRAEEKPQRSLGLWIGVAAALIMLSAGGVFLTRGAESEGPKTASVEAASVTPSKLSLDSSPSGALVTENGRVLGKTPLELNLSFAGQTTRELELSLDGYRAHLLTLTEADLQRPVAVELLPQPAEDQGPEAIQVDEAPEPEDAAVVAPAVVAPAVVRPRPAVRPKAQPKAEPDIHMSR